MLAQSPSDSKPTISSRYGKAHTFNCAAELDFRVFDQNRLTGQISSPIHGRAVGSKHQCQVQCELEAVRYRYGIGVNSGNDARRVKVCDRHSCLETKNPDWFWTKSTKFGSPRCTSGIHLMARDAKEPSRDVL